MLDNIYPAAGTSWALISTCGSLVFPKHVLKNRCFEKTSLPPRPLVQLQNRDHTKESPMHEASSSTDMTKGRSVRMEFTKSHAATANNLARQEHRSRISISSLRYRVCRV